MFVKIKPQKIITICYIINAIFLFLYSYTQVDLSLTLSRSSVFQYVQKAFQHIGYYNRPLSTVICAVLFLLMYFLYFYTLYLIKKGRINLKDLWLIIGSVTLILIFAYPAFSYDIFNYLFTAKTVLLYHRNPYTVTPLQFAGFDPWLSFLHWTHLTSAYSPLWIGLSFIPFVFSFGYFLVLLWNFKIFLAFFFILTVWFIEKEMEITNPQNKLYGMAVFALNPLVLIEAVLSPHNDIVMVAFAVLAFYLASKKQIISSLLMLAVSVAIKTMTIFLYPAVFMRYHKKTALILMFIAFLVGTYRKEPLGWYFLWVMPFAGLAAVQTDLVIFLTGISAALIFRYLPFLYYGDYGQLTLIWRNALSVGTISISLVVLICIYFYKNYLIPEKS